MTDYFRLLGQPRRAWLDEAELKNAYHARSFEAHPDANAGAAASSFAELNDAYRVLRDPKLRLDHLLQLEAPELAASAAPIPDALQACFAQITTAVQRAQAVLARLRDSRSAIARGLHQRELLEVRSEIEQLRATVQHLHRAAMGELKSIDDTAAPVHETLQRLAATFAYLNRWMSQLSETQFQLQQA